MRIVLWLVETSLSVRKCSQFYIYIDVKLFMFLFSVVPTFANISAHLQVAVVGSNVFNKSECFLFCELPLLHTFMYIGVI